MSFSFHCTPCNASGECRCKIISLQNLDVTPFVRHTYVACTFRRMLFLPEQRKRSTKTLSLFLFICHSLICTIHRHSLPSAGGSGRTDRKKRWAHPSVPFRPRHDFSPKWRACRGKSHEEEGCGFHGRLCFLRLSASHSSPGLSEHDPLGQSAPLAGGGRGPLATCCVDPREHCIPGVMQTGWTCVRWAWPLLMGCATVPVPFTGGHTVKGKSENFRMT